MGAHTQPALRVVVCVPLLSLSFALFPLGHISSAKAGGSRGADVGVRLKALARGCVEKLVSSGGGQHDDTHVDLTSCDGLSSLDV